MRLSKFFIIVALIFLGAFLVFQPFHNADAALVSCGRLQDDPATSENEKRICTVCDTLVLASTIINFVLFTLVPAIAVLFYLIAGFLILLGGANPGWVATGRTMFKNTTWGLIIIFASWMITNSVLKSIAGNSPFTKDWNKVVCTQTTTQPPPVQKYACGSQGCVANATGQYTEPTCGGVCTALPPSSDPVAITTASLGDAVTGRSYAEPINSTGGTSPYIFSVSSGTLPPGLSLSANGLITGTATTAGDYTFTIKVEDSTSPTKQSATKQLTIRVVAASAAVTISNVEKSNITDTGATITWTTDKPATSQVEYGTSASFGSSTPVSSSQTTSHRVVLTGLTPGTDYSYRAKSSIPGFNAVSSAYTFKTSGSGTLACLFTGINLCQGAALDCSSGKCNIGTGASLNCNPSGCSQYDPAINAAALKTGISAKLLKANMVIESACQVGATNAAGGSYGLMQLQTGTANTNTFKSSCGVTANIDAAWLTNPANATASICIAAYYMRSLSQGVCGSSTRNILAGLSGGSTACQASANCSSDKSCDGSAVRRWECLYDNNAHTVCNGNNSVTGSGSGYNETRYSVVRKMFCESRVTLGGGTPTPTSTSTRTPTPTPTASIPIGDACTMPQTLAQQHNEPYPAKNSSELAQLISCIKGKLPGQSLGSEFTYDVSSPLCNYTRGDRHCDPTCSHTVNSCHYGGRRGNQGALAVDFGNEDLGASGNTNSIINSAISCGAKAGRCENARGQTVACTDPGANHVHINSASCDSN